MRAVRYWIMRLAFVVVWALAAAGCAGAWGLGAPTATLLFTVVLLGGVAACTQPTDGSEADDGWTAKMDADAEGEPDVSPDVDTRGEGTWGQCCRDGEISSCFCPAGVACNYGRFTRCGGDKCAIGGRGCPDAGDTSDIPDAGDTSDVPDVTDGGDTVDTAEGRWQECCKDGRIDTCFCPAGAACNYGWFTDCGNGYCTYGNDLAACPDVGDATDGPEAYSQ